MTLDGIVFDLDGTLVDTNATHVDAWVQGLAANGYRFSAERIAPEIGKGGDMLLPALLGTACAEQEGEAIRHSVSAVFERLSRERRFRIFDGVEALLAELRARGLGLALATSAAESDLDVIMRSVGTDLRASFDAVVTKNDVTVSKPEPDVVTCAVAKLGLSPAQCVMIGDTPYDATAARRAGVVTLGVLSSGLADAKTLQHRLVTAGARRAWSGTAALLADLDCALQVASPSRVRLTREQQEAYMGEALSVARAALEHGEAPIGCVIVNGAGTVIARAYNEMQVSGNKTAHAEIVAFSRTVGKIELAANDLLLVSTLEPCVMCTGAAMVSAVDTILFALRAPADSGSWRVTPPESPESQMPRIVGDVLADRSRALIEEWLTSGPPESQARYGRQLLGDQVTASDEPSNLE